MIHYNESAKTYHAFAAMGSSDIRDFIRSPRLFRDRMDGLLPVAESEAMAFGTAFHCAVLEPEKFAAGYVTKPDGMSLATKEGKAWRDQHEGATIISAKDQTRIDFMLARMPAEAKALLSGGKSEVTFRVGLAGFQAQCRADHISEDLTMMSDLKTISAIEKVEKEIFNRGYHIQARWYQRVVQSETGKIPEFRLVFCESAAPYRWKIVQLDADYFMLADEKIEAALADIAKREKSEDWSDPSDLHLVASPPSWLENNTEDEDE